LEKTTFSSLKSPGRVASLLATLEESSVQEIENTKKFLRWMADDSLLDMLDKHRRAMEKMTHAPAN